MGRIFIIIFLFISFIGKSQSRNDSLLLLAKLYGVSEFVLKNREVSQEVIRQTINFHKRGVIPNYDGVVSQLFPNPLKKKYKIIDTANLMIVNNPTTLLNSQLLSKESKAKLRYGILAKNGSYKMIKKEFHSFSYTGEDKELDSIAVLEGYFRLWNGIAYGYPYKKELPKDWDSLFPIYLDQFFDDEVREKKKYVDALSRLSNHLNDGHTSLLPYQSHEDFKKHIKEHNKRERKKEKKEDQPKDTARYPFYPVDLRMINRVLYVKNVKEGLNNGLNKGDVIEEINGISPLVWNDSLLKKYPVARPELLVKKRNNERQWLAIGQGKPLALKVAGRSDIVLLEKELMLFSEFYKMTGQDQWRSSSPKGEAEYAYIPIWTRDKKAFKSEAKRSIKEDIPIIIDLRNYPNKLFVTFLPKYFSSKPKDIADLHLPLKNYPGFYKTIETNTYYYTNYTDLVLKALHILPPKTNIFFPIGKKNRNKVVVLIDEYTKSWGETMALMMREYAEDVTLIGRNTGGSNGNAGSVVLPAKMELTFTHYRLDAEGGISYQHRGIPPDIYVERRIPTKDHTDPDPIITTALNYLFNEKAVVK